MTVYNHIAGGIVFTGSFCSLFNVNIFESKTSIFVCVIACMLPDIDHTKSLLGKLFYPLSKWISRKYGHRTITHSLVTFIPLSLGFTFVENIYSPDTSLALIFTFGYLSHLILDMITLQGIPLFYPFTRNPCVIPANPKLRIRTGNLKSEGIALFCFSILTFTFQPLFANGFWTTYNKKFNDITHVYREFNTNNQVLKIDYLYTHFGELIKGSGIVVESSPNDVRVLSGDELVVINKDVNTIIQKFDFVKTDSIYITHEVDFNRITLDSLNRLITNKYILDSQIFASDKIIYDNKEVYSYKLSSVINPLLPRLIKVDNKEDISLNSRIDFERSQIHKQLQERKLLESKIVELDNRYNTSNNYERDKIIKELKVLKSKLSSHSVDYSKLRALQKSKSRVIVKEDISFSGSLNYLDFRLGN